jgi:transposase
MGSPKRYELTDFEWSIIAPLLPNKPRGVPRVDDRRVLNGIYWRLRTGSPWADIPERYGPSTTCYNRLDPGSSARREYKKTEPHEGGEPRARCMRRSRGGLTTKIHALVDANGNPIALKLSEGQAHDGRNALSFLERIGPGEVLLADRAYDNDLIRQTVADQGGWSRARSAPLRRSTSCSPRSSRCGRTAG